MKNENFYVIQGWMVNELNLSGNELMIYAIIYGFSQESNSWYEGSLSYLSSFINCKSKTTVLSVLKELQEKGLVEKQEHEINNVKFCKYRTVYQNLIYPVSKFDTNNYIINNKENNIIINNNIKKERFKKPTLEEIQSYIKEKNININAKQFFDYFEEGNWKDSKGNQVKNWKQKLLTWSRFSNKQKKNSKGWEDDFWNE